MHLRHPARPQHSLARRALSATRGLARGGLGTRRLFSSAFFDWHLMATMHIRRLYSVISDITKVKVFATVPIHSTRSAREGHHRNLEIEVLAEAIHTHLTWLGGPNNLLPKSNIRGLQILVICVGHRGVTGSHIASCSEKEKGFLRFPSERTRIAHLRSPAIFTADEGTARNSAARTIFTHFLRRENRGSLSIFFGEEIAHLGAPKNRENFLGSGKNRRHSRTESRDFGALRLPCCDLCRSCFS